MEKDKSQYMVDKDSVKLVNSSSVTFDIKHEVTTCCWGRGVAEFVTNYKLC